MAMVQIQNINWKKDTDFYVYISLFNIETKERSILKVNDIKFNFALSKHRFCTGFFKDKKHFPCRNLGMPTILTSISSQCYLCEKEEGFRDAFLFGKEPNENAKKYLAQEHYVYLAYFSPNIIKVGTSSLERKEIRPIEQDALIYAYIAKSDGFNIQKLEHEISKRFNITESVSSRHKVKYLFQKPIIENAKFKITNLFNKITDYYKDTEYKTWFLKELNIINHSDKPYIKYPETLDDFIYSAEFLCGKFVGLRGKILIVENYGNIIGIYKDNIIGHFIEGDSNEKYLPVKEQNNLQQPLFK